MSSRYVAVVCAIVASMLALFAGAELLGVSLLTDPRPWLEDHEVAAALVSVGLLLADVLAPVASSAVMTANGAIFGVAAGALLSFVGSLGAASLAFALGRRGSSLLDRVAPPSGRARADAFLARWGALAIVFSRPVPIAAETLALLAGASPLTWRRFLPAAALGCLPPAVLYALAGALVI